MEKLLTGILFVLGFHGVLLIGSLIAIYVRLGEIKREIRIARNSQRM